MPEVDGRAVIGTIESVAVLRDTTGRLCVLLFDGARAVSLAPLSDQVAKDLRDALSTMLGDQ